MDFEYAESGSWVCELMIWAPDNGILGSPLRFEELRYASRPGKGAFRFAIVDLRLFRRREPTAEQPLQCKGLNNFRFTIYEF